MLSATFLDQFIQKGIDLIYATEAADLFKLINRYERLKSYLGFTDDTALQQDIDRTIHHPNERLSFYHKIDSFVKVDKRHRVRGAKALHYRLNRLYERTPILLAENDRIKKAIAELPQDYLEIVESTLFSDHFLPLRTFWHHQDISTFTHVLDVSLRAYKVAKRLKLDYFAAAHGGLLHDYYKYDWHLEDVRLTDDRKIPFFDLHFFIHGPLAAENVSEDFPHLVGPDPDCVIRNIISSHIPIIALLFWKYPRQVRCHQSWEARVVSLCDMASSFGIFKNPLKNIGINFQGPIARDFLKSK
ncbi:hypothetical protein FWH13_03255 [Candidatus Saccharibacteria bacterium]|nr:hypothetical protein [Candidatus Saccharibacteria bacterium]